MQNQPLRQQDLAKQCLVSHYTWHDAKNLGSQLCGSHIGLFMSAYLLCGAAFSEELLIAVASNFSGPMAELVKRFEAQTGHDIQVAYGSSGRLFAQIRSGAPFQIFLSADQDKPADWLIWPGRPASRFTYASGELVLWSADSSREVVDSNALLSPDVQWIGASQPPTRALRNCGR